MVKGFAAMFERQQPVLRRIVETVDNGKFAVKLLKSQHRSAKTVLTNLAVTLKLVFGISNSAYQSTLRPLYRSLMEQLYLPLFPSLTTVVKATNAFFEADRSGVLRLEATPAGPACGQRVSLPATLSVELTMDSIRNGLGKLDAGRNKLVVIASVDHRKITRKRDQTVCGHKLLNLRGQALPSSL